MRSAFLRKVLLVNVAMDLLRNLQKVVEEKLSASVIRFSIANLLGYGYTRSAFLMGVPTPINIDR